MAGLNLRGDTSGSVEIVSPAVAGDNTITLPNDNGSANQFFKNSTTAGIITHSSMIEDASGNIGIGTDSPDTLFHVEGDNASIKLLDNSPGGDNDYTLISHTNGTTSIDSYFNDGAGQTRFRQGSTEALRIDTSGNVSIGRTNPVASLHVQNNDNSPGGAIQTWTADTGTNVRSSSLLAPEIDDPNEPFIFYTNNAWQFRVDSNDVLSITSASNGRVGIGTDNPARLLELAGSGGANNVELRLNATDGGERQITFTGSGSNTHTIKSTGTTDNSLTFIQGSDERMRINSNGDVGIGTDSPQQKLCVAGPGASAIIDIKRTNTNATGAFGAINFTAIDGHSVASMLASADGDDEGAHLRFKTTTAAGENDPYGSNTTEALRITSTQSVYMGNYFDPINNLRDTQTTVDRQAKVQIVGNNGPGAGLALVSYNDGGSGYYSPHLWLAKSDTSTTGNNNRVEDGEDLGSICFAGSDGTRFLNAAAIITEVDGGAGANDMPGRLEFHVCANGASTLTERFRIQQSGDLLGTDTTIGALSDSRLKTNISDFTYDLELFKQFQPRTFDWINPELHDNAVGQRGFIAQEIESVDSTYVFESKIKESSDDSQLVGDDNVAKSAKLGKNDAMYISVIQQLISKIETLETKVAALEGN